MVFVDGPIVHFYQAATDAVALLDGKKGQFNRLSEAVYALKVEAARENWWATLPDSVLGVEQTPTKIYYAPEKALGLLQEYEGHWQKIFDDIRAHRDIRPEVAERYIRFLQGGE